MADAPEKNQLSPDAQAAQKAKIGAEKALQEPPRVIAGLPVGPRAKVAGKTKVSRGMAIAKVSVFVASFYPLARLGILGAMNDLGANPIEFITRSTGLWALVFLCITLAITPARRLTGSNNLIRFRRMLGLFCFFYATLHLTTYVWFDQWFAWGAIAKDIAKRPFILVGFSGFILLLALAATSPKIAARKLGRNWGRLHKLIYAVAILALLHFWWMKAGKHDFKLPIIYGAILGALLLFRVAWWAKSRAQSTRLMARAK